jgi:general secretion pathway protein I
VSRGFTLVEVLVALMVVAIGLAALLSAVSGAARTSGYLRDKTLAQWIALNRIAEVRLTANKLADNTDTGQLDFANRTWHYDTRYFDTSFSTMKRVVVRVWAGDAKTKGNPLAESTGFLGSAIATPGGSNVDWTAGTTVASAAAASGGNGAAATQNGAATGSTSATQTTNSGGNGTPVPVSPAPPPTTPQ